MRPGWPPLDVDTAMRRFVCCGFAAQYPGGNARWNLGCGAGEAVLLSVASRRWDRSIMTRVDRHRHAPRRPTWRRGGVSGARMAGLRAIIYEPPIHCSGHHRVAGVPEGGDYLSSRGWFHTRVGLAVGLQPDRGAARSRQ